MCAAGENVAAFREAADAKCHVYTCTVEHINVTALAVPKKCKMCVTSELQSTWFNAKKVLQGFLQQYEPKDDS
jgi:hypothetical protein